MCGSLHDTSVLIQNCIVVEPHVHTMATHLRSGLDYPMSPTDVVITTTPKAGTTWLQQICHQVNGRLVCLCVCAHVCVCVCVCVVVSSA